MAALLGVEVARALLSWAAEAAAHRSSARVKSELRRALLRRVVDLGPSWLAGRRTADLTTLQYPRYRRTRRLLRQVLAPAGPRGDRAHGGGRRRRCPGLARRGDHRRHRPADPTVHGRGRRDDAASTARRLSTLQRLSGHFLDAVAGLPTLKVFGRAKSYAVAIRQVTDSYRRETMSTLRIAFLSSLVLELVASLSVAVVAVAIGLRLVGGGLDLSTGLFVLVLAPEAYLPLRLLGANFHASADGLAAADQVFTVLEEPLPPRGVRQTSPTRPQRVSRSPMSR